MKLKNEIWHLSPSKQCHFKTPKNDTPFNNVYSCIYSDQRSSKNSNYQSLRPEHIPEKLSVICNSNICQVIYAVNLEAVRLIQTKIVNIKECKQWFFILLTNFNASQPDRRM
jgi:hypothetical protein